MPYIHPDALDYERRRWLRHDAYRFIRPDWRRFVELGSELAAHYEYIERKFNPNQPRVPRGNSGGGQWTSILSNVNFYKPGTRLAANEQKYSVDLDTEERQGGHTIRDHVGKTDEELMAVMNDRGDIGFFGYVRQRQGTFNSLESANDFVNRTLERNTVIVDQVASGNKEDAFIKERFGYITGREAFRPPDPNADPILRNTYGVGVAIVHDSRVSRGYRVYTAYPRND